MNSIRYRVYGRVQGVAYRAFVRDKANQLGILGWVKNKADGSVECLIYGHIKNLTGFESHLRQGPRWARVDRVEKQEIAESLNLQAFEITYDKNMGPG